VGQIYEPITGDTGNPPESGNRGLNFWQRLWGVIASPGTAFQDIAQKPTFWGILLVQLLIGGFLAWLTSPKLQEYTRITLEKTGQSQSMPPEMLQLTLQTIPIQAVIAAVILPVILWLIEAGLIKLYAQFTLGAGTFRQLFAAAVWAGIPTLIGGIVQTIMVMMTTAENLVYVQTSLALLLPKTQTESFLYLFLSQIDFFTVWSLILLAIGAGAVLQQKPRKVGTYLVILWLLLVIGISSLGSYYGGQF
jgi:hypothetical protein